MGVKRLCASAPTKFLQCLAGSSKPRDYQIRSCTQCHKAVPNYPTSWPIIVIVAMLQSWSPQLHPCNRSELRRERDIRLSSRLHLSPPSLNFLPSYPLLNASSIAIYVSRCRYAHFGCFGWPGSLLFIMMSYTAACPPICAQRT